MKAHNTTRNETLIERGRIADSYWTRLRGLIGRGPLEAGEGLLIDPCHGVHMFFMDFPIDVVYVSDAGEVVGLAPNLQPWRIGPIVREARFVLELPAGTIAKTATQVGDEVTVAG